MLKALTILNLFLGSCSLALYARYAGTSGVWTPSIDTGGLLGVGIAGLAAAGTGLKRISILLHGLAMTAFMTYAFGGPASGETSVDLKGLLGRLASKDGLLPVGGLVLSTLGALMDVRSLRRRGSAKETPSSDAAPLAPTPASTSATRPRQAPPTQAAPASTNGTRVVRCSCGKPLRVSVKAKSARCPSCQGVLKLS